MTSLTIGIVTDVGTLVESATPDFTDPVHAATMHTATATTTARRGRDLTTPRLYAVRARPTSEA